MDTQDEIVRIGAGTSETVELWHNALTDNGIESKVVGEDLDGGMGTVIPNSVELWVFEKDAEAAQTFLQQWEQQRKSDTA